MARINSHKFSFKSMQNPQLASESTFAESTISSGYPTWVRRLPLHLKIYGALRTRDKTFMDFKMIKSETVLFMVPDSMESGFLHVMPKTPNRCEISR
ncbi:hypothetical protein L484_013677 [Morus notabilis]|uniref:Uncharacterized protein n=1 Tax=Morus notabilis TaxID=981085 RepID=W9QFM3_9ROSA|nr:hypothetical protein L484_013677 [Morus notabilis]